MNWLLLLKKPTKIIILLIVIITFSLLTVIVYLEATNNSIFESMSHYFIGDTETEITVDEVIPYEKQEIKDDNLEEGTTEIRQEGKDGKKKIIFKITMDQDGKEINRTYVGEEITTEAVDEIIAIGTKAPASSTNSNSGQSGWSNNNGYQSSNGSESNSDSQSSNTPQSTSDDNTTPVRYCKRTWPIGTREEPYIYYYMIRTTQSCQEYCGNRDADNRSYIEVSSAEYYSADLTGSQLGGTPSALLEARRKLCQDWYNGGIEMCK